MSEFPRRHRHDVPDEPITPHEAAGLRLMALAALRGVVVPSHRIPAGIGSGLVKLSRIAGAVEPDTDRDVSRVGRERS